MRNKPQTLKGFILGVLITVTVLLTIGAVNSQTSNDGGDAAQTFQSIATSSDGRTVYVCDSNSVFRSTDGGANWTVVLRKGLNSTSFQNGE